nr:peptidylprolyl isomerase [Pseudomonadota bacterium]
VEDRHRTTPPTYEQLEPELRSQLAQELLSDILKDMEKKAKVERYNWDGTPWVPPAAQPKGDGDSSYTP